MEFDVGFMMKCPQSSGTAGSSSQPFADPHDRHISTTCFATSDKLH